MFAQVMAYNASCAPEAPVVAPCSITCSCAKTFHASLQERVALSLVDDGEQLGPLSPVIRAGDRGVTAAWGRLHGTQALQPCSAAGWKATAVIHMLERRVGRWALAGWRCGVVGFWGLEVSAMGLDYRAWGSGLGVCGILICGLGSGICL